MTVMTTTCREEYLCNFAEILAILRWLLHTQRDRYFSIFCDDPSGSHPGGFIHEGLKPVSICLSSDDGATISPATTNITVSQGSSSFSISLESIRRVDVACRIYFWNTENPYFIRAFKSMPSSSRLIGPRLAGIVEEFTARFGQDRKPSAQDFYAIHYEKPRM